MERQGFPALPETDVFFCFSAQLQFPGSSESNTRKTASLGNRFSFHFVGALREESFIPKIDFVLQKH